MKKNVLFLLITLLSLFSIPAISQNVVDRDINFEYIRLPIQPINKSITNYQAFVALEYEAEVQARKDAFAKSVVEAEKRYEAEVADYDKKVKEAGVRYAQEMVAYKINQRTQPGLPEPVLTLPAKPEKIILIDYNYYPKSFDQEYLSSTYLNLDGYKKAPENSIVLTALLKGFEYKEPELKINEVSKTKDGVPYKEKEYSYEMRYRYPMGIKVEVPGEGVILNENVEDLNRYNLYRSPKYKSELELIQAFNKVAVLNSMEDKIVGENLRYINDLMNNRFGFSKVRAREEICLVQGKKHSYTDYQQAFEAAALGFNQLSADLNRSVASQNLNAAVGMWENALRESQPKNKKARINGNVTTATLFNIALVSIYANEFGKAEIYLNKIFASDAKRRDQRRVEQIKAFLKNQQSRYEAYQKL